MANSSDNLQEAITLVDRISDLPDSLLCHILSFLNTKQVVATSILARRWEYLWTYVDILEFDNYSNFHPNDEVPGKMHFAEFVNRVLLLYRGSSIKKMTLCCHDRGCSEFDIVTWIQTAVFWDIEDLYLRFNPGLNSNVKWPVCLFYSQTLVELKLGFANITNMNIPTAPFFPNLKILHLDRPQYNTDSIKRFISGCSVLLQLVVFLEFHDETCYISSPTLQGIALRTTSSNGENAKLVFNTPSLVVLNIFQWIVSEIWVETSMPFLQKSHISFFNTMLDGNINPDSLVSLSEGLSNVAALYLALATHSTAPVKFDLHSHFHNLTELEIASQFAVDIVRNFMEKSNNLEAITLEKFMCSSDCEKTQVIWDEPQHVPKCILSSLRTISIKEYENEEDVELLINYVLGKAKVLKSVEVHTSDFLKNDLELRFHMLQKIAMFPRASEICQVSFL